jgi:hypothetical protein
MNEALLILQLVSALSREPASVPTVAPVVSTFVETTPPKQASKNIPAKVEINLEGRCDGKKSVCWFYPDGE